MKMQAWNNSGYKPILNKYGRSRWYERENMPYTQDFQIRNEYADWVKQVDWKIFCTLTFAWKVSDQAASKIFDEFINRLERFLKTDVGYVRGDEKRLSGCGKPASGRHFHALMTSVAPMQPAFVESLWMSMAGNRSDHAGAKVEPCNATLPGVAYVLKFINKPEGNWDFRNLHLFHPESRSLQTPTPRQERHLRRHELRFNKFRDE